MNATETTTLLATNVAATATPSNGGTTTTDSTAPLQDVDHHHHHKRNQTNSSSNAYLLGIGFSVGMLVSCIVMIVFVLGFLLSSHLMHDKSQSSSSTSPSTSSLSSNDYTMQVSTTTTKGWDDTTTSTASKAAATTESPFQYVGTQFISFTINTMGGLQEHGECSHRTVDPKSGACYLGDRHNTTHDIEHRLEIVKTILKRIKLDSFQESPDIDHVDNVLKIVSLPEFFWRGPYGAYTIQEVNTMYVYFAQQLRHLIHDDFYNDFIFCFGTIIAARPISSSSKLSNHITINEPPQPLQQQSSSSLHATEMEYYNFAPISRGGTNHHSYIVTKQYISNADFLSRSDTLPNPTEENVRDYADFDPELQTFFEQQANITIVKENVIVIDGLRIGIEICLDHRLGVLWNNILTHHHGTALVDVLLITSAGMAIERGPNPIVPGGVVYLCDGSASSAACIRSHDDTVFHPNQVCRGDTSIIGLKHIPIGSPGYVRFGINMITKYDTITIAHTFL